MNVLGDAFGVVLVNSLCNDSPDDSKQEPHTLASERQVQLEMC